MQTYTTLDGKVLNLSPLTDEERAYFDRCFAAYRDGISFFLFQDLVTGPENPVLRPTQGRITDAVWSHPLFQALRDLEDRIGIQQGELGPDPGDDRAPEPFTSAGPHSAGATRRTA